MSEHISYEKFYQEIGVLNVAFDKLQKRLRGQRWGMWLLGMWLLVISMVLADLKP